MSLEATAYVQAALGLYLAISCFYLLYDYYGNVYKSETNTSTGPFSKHVLCLFISLTIFTFLSSFFIGFLYNNAFNLVDDGSILSSYCLTIMNANIFWFYAQTISLFLILSYFIENMLRLPNNTNSNYNFLSAYYIYYRIIIIVINIYLPIHIVLFLHKDNVSTNMEWQNHATSFVLCELDFNGGAHIALLVIGQIICYSITMIPLIRRYNILLMDHKNQEKKDNNESYIKGIQMVIFYIMVQLIFEIILLSIFAKEPRVSGFILIFLLIIRSTSVYCIYSETKSYVIVYKWPIALYLLIWNAISPLKDPIEMDPNWRWYHKQQKSIDSDEENNEENNNKNNNDSDNKNNNNNSKFKSKTSTRALSSGATLNGSSSNVNYEAAQNEDIDIDEEFNDENSVAFSKISKQSETNIVANPTDEIIINDVDNMKTNHQS